jgi:hypothetical protein
MASSRRADSHVGLRFGYLSTPYLRRTALVFSTAGAERLVRMPCQSDQNSSFNMEPQLPVPFQDNSLLSSHKEHHLRPEKRFQKSCPRQRSIFLRARSFPPP